MRNSCGGNLHVIVPQASPDLYITSIMVICTDLHIELAILRLKGSGTIIESLPVHGRQYWSRLGRVAWTYVVDMKLAPAKFAAHTQSLSHMRAIDQQIKIDRSQVWLIALAAMQPAVEPPSANPMASDILLQDPSHNKSYNRPLHRRASYPTLRNQYRQFSPCTKSLRNYFGNFSSTDPAPQLVSMASRDMTPGPLKILCLNLIANLLTWLLLSGIRALPTALISIRESTWMSNIITAGSVLLAAATDMPLLVAVAACCMCAVVGLLWLLWEKKDYCVWLTSEVSLWVYHLE